MERLTGRNKYGGIISTMHGVHTDVQAKRLLIKLAKYEDTGLVPEEIILLKAERDAAIADLAPMNDCATCSFKEKDDVGRYACDFFGMGEKYSDCTNWQWRGAEKALKERENT